MTSLLTVTHRSVFEFLKEQPFEGRVTHNILRCASNFLEYLYSWSKWKSATHRTEWFYQPIKKIAGDLIGYGIESVRKSILFLIELGILGRRKNPRNQQDKTYQYKLLLPSSQMEALHRIENVLQEKDADLAAALVEEGLAVRSDKGRLVLVAGMSKAVDFVSRFRNEENKSRRSKSRSSGSENQQHHRDQTNIPPESSKPFSTPLPPETTEPEKEGEDEVLDAEVIEAESVSTPIQQPRTTPESRPQQAIQVWGGVQGSEDVLIGNSKKHPALVYAGKDTPWLEEPSRRDVRFGTVSWNKAFLEWGGARFIQQFGKADRFMAIRDFRRSMEKDPTVVLTNWEEYEGHMGATLQNVADRAAAGVTLDDKDLTKLEKHHRAVANTQIHIPAPQPVLADVAEVAHDRRVAEVDWDRIGREADEVLQVEVEPVVKSVTPLPVTEAEPEPEPEYSTPGQFQQMMGNLMKSFGGRFTETKPLIPKKDSGNPAPSSDTDLVARAIATNDPILLNDPYISAQLLKRAELGLVSLRKKGNQIISVEDGF